MDWDSAREAFQGRPPHAGIPLGKARNTGDTCRLNLVNNHLFIVADLAGVILVVNHHGIQVRAANHIKQSIKTATPAVQEVM